MKIKKITIFQHDLPVKGGSYRMANALVTSLDTTLVRVESECGQVGWGETCPVGPTYAPGHGGGARAALIEMAPGLIGAPLDQPLLLHRTMDSLLNGHRYAKAAIDIAMYDALGKKLGRSVADLLGGAATDSVPSYYASAVGEPDDIANVAAEKLAEGYQRMQIKISGRPVEIDIEVVHKVWERVGNKLRLAIDGNRGLNTRDALLLSRACSHIPFVFEQPCDTLQEIRAIRSQLNHPVYIDESSVDLPTCIEAAGTGWVDGFGMKVTRIGGLFPMSCFRDLCEARHLPHTADDAWGGDILAAACTHMGATVNPKTFEGTWLAQPYIEGHYDSAHGVKIEHGAIALPKGSGLGVVPDEGIFHQEVASF
ncbi:MAG: mandelate racemase/muconate lactonizing enzyme family protein [Proteobacteria bacterium]|nr:mandelate racemase/muconate lactonizing enzyme family protein [Pseudomonadota bacterium]